MSFAIPNIFMEPLVEILIGKQGRNDANKPAHELLTTFKSLAMDSETLTDAEIESIANEVLSLAKNHSGHRFDDEYMQTHEGAYGVKTVTINTKFEINAYTMPVYRPTSHGGHKMFRTEKEMQKVLPLTFDDLTPEEAGKLECHLYVSKFKDLECLLLVPSTLEHPKLFRALNLERRGDGSDTTTLVSIRLCDGRGLGRSAPRLSTGKFKFLFPGAPLDSSLVKTNVTKRQKRDDEVIEDVDKTGRSHVSDTPMDVYDKLYDMLEAYGRGLRANVSVPDKIKSALLHMTKEILRTFNWMMETDEFDENFKAYLDIHPSVVVDILGNQDIVRSIAVENIRDHELRFKVIDKIDTMTTSVLEPLLSFCS